MYYIKVLTEEITNSPTFSHISDSSSDFLDNLTRSLHANSSKDKKLPHLYATAKMHKNPSKFRFITAARNTVLSDLSIAVSKCLKLFLKTSQMSYKYRINHLENCIFIVDSRDKIINAINSSNFDKIKHKSLSTWDFSTLYTNIPHQKLKDNVKCFIMSIFDLVTQSKKAAKCVCSGKAKLAYFSKSRSKSNVCFSCDELIDDINTIIDNSYVLFQNNVYRQVIGIPMGTNCPPFLANIFLHQYEYDYLVKLVERNDVETARMLSHTYRYQDDCIAINVKGTFGDHYFNIYPPEMTLENSNISKAVCTFLDMRLSVFRGQFRYCSYGKRNEFGYHICNYPNLHGNIPYKQAYGVYMAQIIRFCNINLLVNSFINDISIMTVKFMKQGFGKTWLMDIFKTFYIRYFYKWAKYGVNLMNYMDKMFI